MVYQLDEIQSSRHNWEGLWAKEHGIHLMIYFTTKHGYGLGYDYHDYDADMNFGMAIFLYEQLEIGNGRLAYGRRIEGSWSIGYVFSLYNLGIVNGMLA